MSAGADPPIDEELWLAEPYISSQNEEKPEQWTCLLCNITGTGTHELGMHCGGSKHNKKLKVLLEDPYLEKMPNLDRNSAEWKCLLCHTDAMSKETTKKHCSGAQHLCQLRILLESHFSNQKRQQKNDLQWLDEPYIHGSLDQETQQEQWTCLLCKEKQMSLENLGSHCRGTPHHSKIKALEDSYLEIHSNHWKCLICKEKVAADSVTNHCKGSRHQKRFRRVLSSKFRDAKKAIDNSHLPEEASPKMERYRSLQDRIWALDDTHEQWHVNHLLMRDLLEGTSSSTYFAEATHVLEQYESEQKNSSFIQKILASMTCTNDRTQSLDYVNKEKPAILTKGGGSSVRSEKDFDTTSTKEEKSIVDVVVSSPSSASSSSSASSYDPSYDEEQRDAPLQDETFWTSASADETYSYGSESHYSTLTFEEKEMEKEDDQASMFASVFTWN